MSVKRPVGRVRDHWLWEIADVPYRGFFGLYESDHPEATSSSDLASVCWVQMRERNDFLGDHQSSAADETGPGFSPRKVVSIGHVVRTNSQKSDNSPYPLLI